jgi:GMP synthase (glutamine-hydrolysing)
MAQNKSIAIVDFGSQYTHLIRRSITELGVEAQVYLPDADLALLKEHSGLILSGGPSSVLDPSCPTVSKDIFSLGIPILGICYGHQLMALNLGATVIPGVAAEYGRAVLSSQGGELLKGLGVSEQVWMSHGDEVAAPPPGFVTVGTTISCLVAAMEDNRRRLYGIQFHPEVEHTLHGQKILSNFVIDICGCLPNFSTKSQVDALVDEIKKDVAEKNVFLLVSGGVDSTVAFLLLSEALGNDRVYGLHINTGLLREGETDRVRALMASLGLTNFHVVDASEQFYNSLMDLTDPEEKRKAVAKTFLKVKDEAMAKLGLDDENWVLGQGTIYPDLIASGVTTHSHTIKTHHNSLLDERTRLHLVEPLKMLYKDEVRKIGVHLGLPEDFVWQEPFPGPGISIRIIGRVTPAKISIQRRVDEVVAEALRPTPWFRRVWHRFPVLAVISEFGPAEAREHVLGDYTSERHTTAIQCQSVLEKVLAEDGIAHDSAECLLLPLRTVGIKGDARSYEAPVAVSVRGHDRQLIRLPYDTIQKISTRMTNHVKGVNRMALDITPAPPGRFQTLIFLRLITSRDAMTADWAHVEHDLLETIALRITSECLVDRVYLDATQKPPSMMEWE